MIKDTLTYDIVGSFLRPAEIKEARKAYKDGKISKEELTQSRRSCNRITGRKGSGTRFEICNRRRIPPQVVAFGLAQRI